MEDIVLRRARTRTEGVVVRQQESQRRVFMVVPLAQKGKMCGWSTRTDRAAGEHRKRRVAGK